MSVDPGDLQPDQYEVLQEEDPNAFAVPVRIADSDTPLNTRVLPNRAAASRTVLLTSTTNPLQLLRADKRRANAYVLAVDMDVWLATNYAAAQDTSRMFYLPAGAMLPLGATEEVWVLPTSSGQARVSYITELWGAGDGTM